MPQNFKFTARLKRSVFNERCFLITSKTFTKLKKKKWSSLLKNRRTLNSYVRNDVHLIHGKILDLRKNYKNGLNRKQKFSIFFSSLKERFIKKLFRYSKNWSFLDFIDKLEMRIDIVLFRANLVNSLYSARSCINNRLVYVNCTVMSSPAYLLNIGDIIEIKSTSLILPFSKATFLFPSGFLEINYEILSVIILKKPSKEKPSNFGLFYTFFLGFFDIKNFKKIT